MSRFVPDAVAAGRYRTLRLLGSGGMGIVVAAHDERLDRTVAIKLLADNLACDPEARERFAREARAAARLAHPNVVQVFDVGEEDGRPYIVMEHVAGGSLGEIVQRDGPLAPHNVVDLARQVLGGLGSAHAAGLLHRDLKPANLLCADDGSVKVTDFGVAQAAETPGLTRTGLVFGTRDYLAPERLRGQPASRASDLYGVGASLLEALTGRPPDDEPVGARLAAVDDVPDGLVGLLATCLAADPEERPADCEEALAILDGRQRTMPLHVDDALTRPIADDPTLVAPVPAAEPPPAAQPEAPWTPRARGSADGTPDPSRRYAAIGLGAAALVVVLALAATAGGGDEPAPEATPATAAPDDGGAPPLEPAADPRETARRIEQYVRDLSEDG